LKRQAVDKSDIFVPSSDNARDCFAAHGNTLAAEALQSARNVHVFQAVAEIAS